MDLFSLIAMSAVMGFSIFIILPFAALIRVSPKSLIFLNTLSIGILLYLLLDIFMGTYTFVNPGFENGTFNIQLSMIILLGTVLSFAAFSFYPSIVRKNRNEVGRENNVSLAYIMAWGIGLQNLTEGLALGSSIKLGLSALVLPILVGFTLQNVTEGFPIVAPFIRENEAIPLANLSTALFIGGFPTLIGAFLSFYVASVPFTVAFNSVALGSILFVILQMYRMSVKTEGFQGSPYGNLGIIAGFVVAFMVNLLP